VRLSELFAPGKDSLVIYNFMFPRDPGDSSRAPASGQTALLDLAECPCASCTALLDQLDGAAEHAEGRPTDWYEHVLGDDRFRAAGVAGFSLMPRSVERP
jgi:predicted dithiol-disulfide oxidoreductase (DUF899 family)